MRGCPEALAQHRQPWQCPTCTVNLVGFLAATVGLRRFSVYNARSNTLACHKAVDAIERQLGYALRYAMHAASRRA